MSVMRNLKTAKALGLTIPPAVLAAIAAVAALPPPAHVVEICNKRTRDALAEVGNTRKELADIVQTNPPKPGEDAKIAELQKKISRLVHCPVSSGPTPGDISWGAWDQNRIVEAEHHDGPSPSRAFA